MITKETIEKIIDAARIEEVVGDFVDLKKRGVNLIGLCPFHNEKTPSFNVNVSRNIFKCFGCGKGGDAVHFIMEHEKYSYPEALKYLAQKYQIEVEETISENRDPEQDDRRESLFIVSEFAAKYFAANLSESGEGKNIGLTYLKERGFREDIIRKFSLGYSLSSYDAFTKKALQDGYKTEFLEASGLCIKKDNGDLIDRFRSRVMFPVHNLTGRVIAFGGRILKKDEKSPKYLNSPESEIYHKSQVLYGLYFAKAAIRQHDHCLLVEGYTDVVSLHQSEIENVVASSGTSLTVEQIKLISRFTRNIVILYDGDPAGIKASLRGIDLILEEGLNVKIVLFPEGEDPDSYIQKVGGKAFRDFISQHQKDFIVFKTSLLLEEVKHDPVKKAALIYDIVESIAKIPDSIKASLFIKECSILMNMDERLLLAEYNKLKIKLANKKSSDVLPTKENAEGTEVITDVEPPKPMLDDEAQEKDIVRLLFSYGHLDWSEDLSIARYILHELEHAEIKNPIYNSIFEQYRSQLDIGSVPDQNYFIHHADPTIANLVSTLLSSPYQLSPNWYNMHHILVPREEEGVKKAVENTLDHLKLKKLLRMISDNQLSMKDAQSDEEIIRKQVIHLTLTALKRELSAKLGAVILK